MYDQFQHTSSPKEAESETTVEKLDEADNLLALSLQSSGCDTPAASSADGGDRTEHGEDKTDRAERKARRKRHKDGAPRFPVYYIKPQMKLLGCKKMTGA